MAIPIRKTFASYAGVPKNKKIPKSLTIPEIMANAPRKRGQQIYKRKGVSPIIMKKGIFIRTSGGLRMLYAFVDKATHKKKTLDYQTATERTYNKNLERSIKREYIKLLKR